MKEILNALGLNAPAIAIILALGGLIIFMIRNMFKQLYTRDKEWRDKTSNDIEEIKKCVQTQSKALIQVIYHQCLDEAIKWRDIGYIDSNAKIQFNFEWNKYIELGDGLGDEPKQIIEKLEIKT